MKGRGFHHRPCGRNTVRTISECVSFQSSSGIKEMEKMRDNKNSNLESIIKHYQLDFSYFSDFSNGGDGMLATSSNGSQYSGSRVETPVSYVGDDDDDDDDFNENDDDD